MFLPKRFISAKLSKTFLENVFESRTVVCRLQSQSSRVDDIFKFYSDRESHRPDDRVLGPQEYDRFISRRSALREPALTRQLTSLAYKVGKDVISLAEGMPNEEVFPVSALSLDLKDGQQILLQGAELATALQYLPSQGLPELLNALRQHQQDLHRPPHWRERDVIVTSGSQHGIYMCLDALVEPRDPVLLQAHSYTGAHVVLKPYKPEILAVPEDESGIIPELLKALLDERLASGLKMPRVLYLVPTGSNPSGTVIPEERRRKIYDLACDYNFIILEDDPYMFMNYTEVSVPSFLSLDSQGRVVRLDSLSKVLAPGLRVGWVTAPAPLLHKLELHMQADQLHTCTLGQALLFQLLKRWGRDGLAQQLSTARDMYLLRRDTLHAALQRWVGPLATWSLPDAGMFFWLKLNVDDVYDMVFKTAFEKGLMLVPGQACTFETGATSSYIRLAFSKVKLEDMEQAARLLAEVIRIEQSKVREQSQRLAS